MTFKELIDMTLDRVDEDKTNPDALALSVIKSGLNQGYAILCTRLDPQTATITYPYEKAHKLPRDFHDFVNVSHSASGDLSDVDYEKKADLLYIRNRSIRNGNITVTYVAYPAPLKLDTDEVKLSDSYAHALSAYGAYTFQLHRRKYSAAQMLLQEFNSFIGGGEVES